MQVVNCAVEPAPPHRIRATTTIALIPPYLTPRLPADFTGYPELAGRGAGARLIVFSGLPGAGKGTLAEAAGRQLRVPVFAVDWLLGSLTPFGGYHLDEAFGVGGELLRSRTLSRPANRPLNDRSAPVIESDSTSSFDCRDIFPHPGPRSTAAAPPRHPPAPP